MEKILIKDLDLKPSGMLVVHYNGNKQATMNKKWQSQEIDYLFNDVGLGGSVEVEIVIKGQYTNITKVDMASGVKNANYTPQEAQQSQNNTPVELPNLKDEKILAQVLVKGAVEMAKGHSFANLQDESQYMSECISELYSLYKVALSIQNE